MSDTMDQGKYAVLTLYDWDGLRKSILADLKRLGKDISIIPEDERKIRKNENEH